MIFSEFPILYPINICMSLKPSVANMHTQLYLQIISLLILFSTTISSSRNIIESIPGFPGKLPFYLETGYVELGENNQVQMFYYFVKSERNPEKDPLMLWLTGGPGCSAFSGLILEIGPLMFNTSACNWHSKAPTYQLNPHSWTKVASIIFLDSPIGTGFSSSTNSKDYESNDDITSSKYNFQFLRKWLMDHAGFRKNPLYISGDSYNGKIVPIVVQEIFHGNKFGLQYPMNLQGYVLGNPFTRKEDEHKLRYAYAHRVSLLSDELYKSARTSCNDTFIDIEMDNVKCLHDREVVSYNLEPLFESHVLMPKCISDQTWCQESIYNLLEFWANDVQVQATLHIREGTSHWVRCNWSLSYTRNIESTVEYHQNFTKQESIRALVYSGDQDMKVSYLGTLEWIRELNVPIVEDWRPWFVNGQVAGYTTKFSNDNYQLTYATVKGAGHTAPEYKRRECFSMIMNWLSMSPL